MARPGSSLHLLSIDLDSAPKDLRAALALGPEDVEHWLECARAADAPLAIVCGPDCVDLYSSEAGRRAAFRPLLESLRSLGSKREGFGRVRTREAVGHAALRHLLRQAAGLASMEHGLSYASAIRAASGQALLFSTLSAELRQLFNWALQTAYRCERETELSAPYSTHASRQVEALSAERIYEEQLVAFQLAAEGDELERSSVAAPPASLPPYSSEEAGSCVRLRVAPLSPLRTAERSSR